MASRRYLKLLAAAVTDSTFERTRLDGVDVWVGKCLHCNAKLVVRDDGRAMGNATLEHIWPTAQGGTDTIENFGVACAGCNREKGKRHDHGKGDRDRLVEVAQALAERRRARWRDPDSVGMATRLADLVGVEEDEAGDD
jgi:5-methylcytosine-specific restriction endonuclease McrA